MEVLVDGGVFLDIVPHAEPSEQLRADAEGSTCADKKPGRGSHSAT